MNFTFSFSGSIQEEGQQAPLKMEVLKGHNRLSKANNCEPSKEETSGDIKWAKVLLSGALSFLLFSPFLDVSSSSASFVASSSSFFAVTSLS